MSNIKSIFHVVIGILFGIFFVSTIVIDQTPKDFIQIRIETVWSLIAIIDGCFATLKIDWVTKRNTELFRKFGFEQMAKNNSEPYMKPFGRTIALVFVCIGITLLLQNYTNLF